MTSRKLFNYPESAMRDALKAIREEGQPIARACKLYKVPRTSVRNRLAGKTADECRKVGPSCVLGKEVEKKLVHWILDCASKGFPINREGLLYSVQKIITECGIDTKFLNKTPGRKWFDSFMKRHPEVSKKHAEFINKARAAVSEKSIRLWFNNTRQLLGADSEVLNHPQRIFNMDETAVFLSPKGTLVLGPKGKNIYDVGISDKDNVTTLIAVNADGMIAPPLTIFKFKRLPKVYGETAPKDWAIGISDTGWMQSKQFYEYFANVFIAFLDSKGIPRPVIVFVDGHASHLSLHLSKLCREANIILICLPANTTHLLQPLDVSFFFPLKQAWKKIVRKWLYDHDGRSIQKKDIPTALHSILTQKDFSKSIQSGFRSCGLYPFDENAPNYNKCIKKDLTPNSDANVILDTADQKSHFQFLEDNIDPFVLQMFKGAYLNNSFWQGEERYLELYNLWKKIKENCEPQWANVQIPMELEASTSHHQRFDPQPISQTGTNVDPDELIIFDFPEFDSLGTAVQSDNEHENMIVKSNDSEDMLSATNNNITADKQKINIIQDIRISSDMRLFKKRTVSEVLKDTRTWPEENDKNKTTELPTVLTSANKSNKKKAMPSVVTSDIWVEIMEAKENANIEKENVVKAKRMKRENNIKKKKKLDPMANNVVKNRTEETSKELKVGSYVIVTYDNELYPAKIVDIDNEQYYCCAMTKSGLEHWKWPDKNDLLWYSKQDIVLNIEQPKQINARGIFLVPEIGILLNKTK